MPESKPCMSCAAFRRGDEENIVYAGVVIHTCDRAPQGAVQPDGTCPCGCADREPGQIEIDQQLYGNAFLGPLGERLDPRRITVVKQ